MPDSLARAIVSEALGLQKSRPDLTPLQVLDLAMRGRRGTGPDFGSIVDPPADRLLDPSGEFGMLLAAAFDEQVTFSGLRTLGDSPETRHANAFEEFWVERVMRAFVRRYNLHLPHGPTAGA